MRTICPQVSGVYGNNNAEDGDPFPCWLLGNDGPQRELVATHAYKCNRFAEIDPAHGHPFECLPGDFGDFIRPVCLQRPIDDALYDALGLVWQLADSNCLDQENDPEDGSTDGAIAIECRRQRDALSLVHDYLVNHPLAD